MTKISEEEKKEFQKNKEVINLKEFMLLKSDKQDEQIKEVLNKVYEEKLVINKKYIDKVLNVAFDNKDNETFLPHNLCVQKDGNKLIFSYKKSNKAIVVIFLLGFLFISGFATFSGMQLLGKAKMNIDLNNDGIADLNLDINDDGLCEVNCSNDGEKPEFNIDHGTMRKALFNVKLEDGSLFNLMNQKNDEGICLLNCDTDDDGWPNINIDLDGDGVADINIDVDKDGSPDLNIDTNGDGVADINIDENNDGACDKLCSYIVNKNGQATIGGGDVTLDTASLVVTFASGSDIKINNLYPDDQPDEGVTKTVNNIVFTVENKTANTLKYNLNWIEVENTFETDNFWTKIVSTNNGYNTNNWVVAPKSNGLITQNIEIAANTKQEYTVSFTLHGTGSEQNIDQGKIFKGRILVELLEDN